MGTYSVNKGDTAVPFVQEHLTYPLSRVLFIPLCFHMGKSSSTTVFKPKPLSVSIILFPILNGAQDFTECINLEQNSIRTEPIHQLGQIAKEMSSRVPIQDRLVCEALSLMDIFPLTVTLWNTQGF